MPPPLQHACNNDQITARRALSRNKCLHTQWAALDNIPESQSQIIFFSEIAIYTSIKILSYNVEA